MKLKEVVGVSLEPFANEWAGRPLHAPARRMSSQTREGPLLVTTTDSWTMLGIQGQRRRRASNREEHLAHLELKAVYAHWDRPDHAGVEFLVEALVLS